MRRSNPIFAVAALSSGVVACSLLSPSDEDLFGAAERGGAHGGGRSGSGGGAGMVDPSEGGTDDGGRAGGGGYEGALGGAHAGGAGGAGGAFVEAGTAGSDGAEPVCVVECGANQECTRTSTGAECTCVGGFVPEGTACRLPRSCDELHRAAPDLPSGAYSLQPLGATSSFLSHCGMALEGGGWTLVVSEGPTFDPTTTGVADLCYSTNCTNLAYDRVLLESDVMIDVSNSPVLNATYTARVVISGVHPMSRGKTLRTLFTTGPHYLDAEDNSNVAVRLLDGAECATLPMDWARLVCNTCTTAGCKVPVMVFGDDDSAEGCHSGPVPRFAIGGTNDYATPWTNCAGWPQNPNHGDRDYYPDYVRVWIR